MLRICDINACESGDHLRREVLGVGFDNLTIEEAVAHAAGVIESGSGGYVVTPNPEIVWLCRKNSALLTAIQAAELVLPDGIGIVRGAKLLKRPLKEKVSGVDFSITLIKYLAPRDGSVYLLGAKPGVAERAGEALERDHPGIRVVGTQDGYFERDDTVIDAINEKRPDFLMVCMGAPRQELWMHQNRGKLQVGIMAGLGGVADVLAGETPRAPETWQKLELEWLYRLIKEPGRIRRQIRLPLFLLAVIGQRLKGGDGVG